jgi:SAM-dependent methyltransferase
MSSPIADLRKSPLKEGLVALHQRFSHLSRVRLLAEALTQQLRAILPADAIKLHAVDIGCGDMRVAETIAELDGRIAWTCLDVHTPPPDATDPRSRWAKYRQFDGRQIDSAAQAFDAALFTDVLHHVPENARAPLLIEAARVARFVIIKDHFEYGRASRAALRAMDFLGNWSYGINVPKRYLTRDSFASLLAASQLELRSLSIGIELYQHLPIVRHFTNPRWQFIAVARSR